jgi:hypothetical protein
MRRFFAALLLLVAALEDSTWLRVFDWFGRFKLGKETIDFIRDWQVIPATPYNHVLIYALLVVGSVLLIPTSWWNVQRLRMLSLLGMIICGAGFLVSASIYFDIDNTLPTASQKPNEIDKTRKIAMARRWIALSNDILVDLPSLRSSFSMPPHGPGISDDLYAQLWKQESERSIRAFQDALNAMSTRYSGRLAEARLEMRDNNVSTSAPEDRLLYIPINNSFGWQAWADKLGGEGRRILTSLGEKE